MSRLQGNDALALAHAQRKVNTLRAKGASALDVANAEADVARYAARLESDVEEPAPEPEPAPKPTRKRRTRKPKEA